MRLLNSIWLVKKSYPILIKIFFIGFLNFLFVWRKENKLLESLISIKISEFKINLSPSKNKLLLSSSNNPIFLLNNFVLSKLILPLTTLKLIFDRLKISSLDWLVMVIDESMLIFSLNNNLVFISSLIVELAFNNLDKV